MTIGNHTSDAGDNWDEHWRSYGSSAEFNPAQAFRRDLILRLLDRDAPGALRIIDIGSGQGDLALDLRRRLPQAEILGLELSAAGVEIARSKAPDARFLQCNLIGLVNPPAENRCWATAAVCSEVLEHVDDPAALLRNARAFLAPGCVLIVTVPGGPMSAFDRHIGHRTHYTPATLKTLLQEAGFQVEWTAGAGFPFFNLYRLVVIARGSRLVERAQSASPEQLSTAERLALRMFRTLLRATSKKGDWGWQIIASARESANRE
jgi:SAM-dependent methyltransferase